MKTSMVPWSEMRPAWWPDWMGPPPLMRGGHVRPLGACVECGTEQWSAQTFESHLQSCPRFTTNLVKAPWPRNFRWPLNWEDRKR